MLLVIPWAAFLVSLLVALETSAWCSTHHCHGNKLIWIGCLGAMQTRSSDVVQPRIVATTSGSCTILPSLPGVEWHFSADILVKCLLISPVALVCQPPFRRKQPLFHL